MKGVIFDVVMSLVAAGGFAISAAVVKLTGRRRMADKSHVTVSYNVWDQYPDIPRMCDSLGLDAYRGVNGGVKVEGSEALVNAFCMAFKGIIDSQHVAHGSAQRSSGVSEQVDARMEKIHREPVRQISTVSERDDRRVRRRVVLPERVDGTEG